jgi:hypothetical protein
MLLERRVFWVPLMGSAATVLSIAEVSFLDASTDLALVDEATEAAR